MNKTFLAAIIACGSALAWASIVAAQEADAPPADAPAAETPPADAPPADAPAEDASGRESPAQPSEGALTTRQQQVAERFRELERLLLRMAELTAPTDPRRAALLRRAVAQSKDRAIDQQFEALVELLRQERLASVIKSQGEVQGDLARLLELLLSEDRSKRIESEKERIREYLKRVNKIIRVQKGVQAETQRDGEAGKLADQQSELADQTGELAKDIDADGGKKPDKDAEQQPDKDAQKDDQKDGEKSEPSKDGEKKDPDAESKDGKKKPAGEKSESEKSKGEKSDKKDVEKDAAPPVEPPGQEPGQPGQDGESGQNQDTPAQQRLQQAQQRMQEAQKKLEEAKRDDATQKQAEALRELERAKAELEEILRQLREEEMARTLAMLESRFRKMLDAQIEVYEGTKRVDQVPLERRDRDDEIEAGRMSRQEADIAVEADKALAVLREEGSAVAFPEAVTEMRDDMLTVRDRLGEAKVDEITQGVEQDIIAALEEMIAALQKAQKDMENQQQQQPSAGGGDMEMPLVDTLSELKMIRALQMRVNTRTKRYADMTKTEQVDQPELLEALRSLAQREQRIHRVTRDIVLGRNR